MSTSVRKSPAASATSLPLGTILGHWVVVKTKTGVQRWMPYVSTTLNGFRTLTLDYLTENIGKEIKLYQRESDNFWPRTVKDEGLYNYTFTPNGNVLKGNNKKPYENWLITHEPPIQGRQLFRVEGEMCGLSRRNECFTGYLTIDSVGQKLVTANFLNTETFVRI